MDECRSRCRGNKTGGHPGPLIIFATVAVGIAKMGDMRRVGVVRLRAIIYFEVVSTLALLVGLAVGNLLQLGAGLHIILTRLGNCIASVPTASPMPSSCCSSAPRTGRIFASSRHECGPDGRTEAVQPLPGGDRGTRHTHRNARCGVARGVIPCLS